MNSQDFSDPSTGYRAYIDVDSWIDAHLLGLFAKDPDFLSLSHFMTLQREEKLRADPLWDFDRAFNSIDPRVRSPDVMWSDDGSMRPFEYGWWGRFVGRSPRAHGMVLGARAPTQL